MTLSSVAHAAPEVINICTGAKGQPYEQAAQYIAKAAAGSNKLKINVVSGTGGTWGNIERTVLNDNQTPADFTSGAACHAFIGQPDGLAALAKSNRAAALKLRQIANLHREFLHVVCSNDSGVTTLKQLADAPSKYKVALGNRGSGGWLTWQNLSSYYTELANVPTTTDSGNIALAAVATDAVTCTLVGAGLNGTTMAQANNDFGDKVKLIPADHKSFASAMTPDGKRKLYEIKDIPGGTYKNIQKGWLSTSVSTVTWEAGLYVNGDRILDEGVLSELITVTSRARASILSDFGR